MISTHEQLGGSARAKKIFLGNSPWSKPGHVGMRAGCRWPHFELAISPFMPFPFYLAYCAALLQKHGFEVLIDAIAEKISEDNYFARMKAFNPDLVVHEVATASIRTDLRHAKIVRQILPEAKIFFGGPHHLMYEPKFLTDNKDVDFAVEGEYEIVVLEVAKHMYDQKALDQVQGLTLRDSTGTPKSNGRAPLVPLEELPWPAREFLPMDTYWDNQGDMPTPCLIVHASRGCPFTCNFCQWPQLMYGGNKYRIRDPKDVADEIAYCRDTYGSKSFYFDDDTFNIGKKRIVALCDEFIKHKLNMPWSAMSRADTTDIETLHKMKEAGMVAIKYGVESADQKIVDDCGKKLDLEVATRNIKETIRIGLKCHLSMTVGLPGETPETVKKTMEWVDDVNPDSVQFSIATPYPGSLLYDQLIARGHLLSGDFDEYDGANRSVIRTDAMTPEQIEEAHHKLVSRWHRKRFMTKLWRNKSHYAKECAKHPVVAARVIAGAFQKMGNFAMGNKTPA
jgi:anaerobic magnesium-protoporphyrin IX monomethyl ester cyclase